MNRDGSCFLVQLSGRDRISNTAIADRNIIYYIKGLLFPLQSLVIRELSKEDNIWLSRLRSGLKPDEDIEVLMKEYKGKEQNLLYETAMDLILRANWETCQQVEKMCDLTGLHPGSDAEHILTYTKSWDKV